MIPTDFHPSRRAADRGPLTPQLVTLLAACLLGACVGSFVGTLVLRAPDGWRGMWWGRSHCEACGITLTPADLIPLWSWLWARGRCRHCGARLGLWYPLVELAAIAIAALPVMLLSPPEAWIAAALGWWLLALALIDLRTWLLPDALTLPLLLAGLAAAALGLPPGTSLASAVGGAAAGYAVLAGLGYVYQWLRGRDGLGLGDAKLLGAVGAWLGLDSLPWVVLTAALLGLVLALAQRRPLRAETAVPFGPALALAFWGVLLLQAAR